MVTLKVKLFLGGILPTYAHDGDAAMDIYAAEDVLIRPQSIALVATGIATEFPKGYAMIYESRSGLAGKHGVIVLAGVIDSTWRGEHKVLLFNTRRQSYTVHSGDRIAQAILYKLPDVEIVEVDELSDSERGENGFGSTGK